MGHVVWENRVVKSLEPNQVFVFGSNATGFHGSGGAGFALRGDHRRNWPSDRWFLDAIEKRNDRIGKWAVFGVARGFMSGREGSSYAIQTVTRPGAKHSMTRREIYNQLVELWSWLDKNPYRQAVITPLGEGYAGYSFADMAVVWDYLVEKHGSRNAIFCRPSRSPLGSSN